MGKWKCPNCKAEIEASQDEIDTYGEPTCLNCKGKMEKDKAKSYCTVMGSCNAQMRKGM